MAEHRIPLAWHRAHLSWLRAAGLLRVLCEAGFPATPADASLPVASAHPP